MKKLPSMPRHWSQSSQPPRVIRPPERTSPLTCESPNSTVVPGAPKTPAATWGVPGGLVVTRGGSLGALSHHKRYSPRTQTRGDDKHSGFSQKRGIGSDTESRAFPKGGNMVGIFGSSLSLADAVPSSPVIRDKTFP